VEVKDEPEQIVVEPDKLGIGLSFTVTVTVPVAVHEFAVLLSVKPNVLVPIGTPEVEGVKIEPDKPTPPVNTNDGPATEAPGVTNVARLIAAPFTHTAVELVVKVTELFTVATSEAVTVQPLESVPVYVIVFVEPEETSDGTKLEPLTPLPVNVPPDKITLGVIATGAPNGH